MFVAPGNERHNRNDRWLVQPICLTENNDINSLRFAKLYNDLGKNLKYGVAASDVKMCIIKSLLCNCFLQHVYFKDIIDNHYNCVIVMINIVSVPSHGIKIMSLPYVVMLTQ